MNSKYMYQNKYTAEYEKMSKINYEDTNEPTLVKVNNAFILPLKKYAEDLSWGSGGVLNENKEFVEASGVKNAFGGGYPFDENNTPYIDDTIIFIGVIPNHWGHFLIDSVCRLWPFLEDKNKNYRIAYCGWNWNENGINGNYLQLFELLELDKKLMLIERPVKVKKVLIPERTMGFACNYHALYKKTIDKIVDRALEMQLCKSLIPADRIYFTRTKNLKSKLNEVGEKEIEAIFEKVGFTVMAPEKLSLVEQIFYIRNCKEMAAMSGTIPHNAIFASADMKLIILNRTPLVNPPQMRINQIVGNDCTYVDVYAKEMLKRPKQYGEGPIKIEVSSNLSGYFEDRGWKEGTSPRHLLLIGAKNDICYLGLTVFKEIKSTKLYSIIKTVCIKYHG